MTFLLFLIRLYRAKIGLVILRIEGDYMKKIFSLNKEEKFVLITGIIIILLIIAGGILKSKFIKKEAYVPKDISSSEIANSLTLKKDVFKVAVNSKLDKKAASYVQASSDDLAKVKMDFSKVKMDTEGSYKATATLGNEKLTFTIEVVKDAKPVFKVVNENFQFVIEETSTIDEVKQYAGVSVKDNEGNDITSNITGWPEKLPTKASTVTYTLTAKDASGNSAVQKISVQYLIKEATGTTQNTENTESPEVTE